MPLGTGRFGGTGSAAHTGGPLPRSTSSPDPSWPEPPPGGFTDGDPSQAPASATAIPRGNAWNLAHGHVFMAAG
jgi:hypothetical protein